MALTTRKQHSLPFRTSTSRFMCSCRSTCLYVDILNHTSEPMTMSTSLLSPRSCSIDINQATKQPSSSAVFLSCLLLSSPFHPYPPIYPASQQASQQTLIHLRLYLIDLLYKQPETPKSQNTPIQPHSTRRCIPSSHRDQVLKPHTTRYCQLISTYPSFSLQKPVPYPHSRKEGV
jgi:hypothetical protein